MIASSWLGEPISFCCSTNSAISPVAASTATASFRMRLAARTASGLLLAISFAVSSAAARGSSTIFVTKPSCWASVPLKMRPV